VKQKFIPKIFVFLFISLFIVSFFPQIKNSTLAESNIWVALPMHTLQVVDPLGYSGYIPSQIRAAYRLPPSGGAGTTIAIIDVGDTPSVNSDLTVFSNAFGLPPSNSTYFEIEKMPGVGTANSSWVTETCLDVEWAHAIAPNAKILLVEAKSSYSSDLLSAVDYARNRPDVVAVSMSWGGLENGAVSALDYHFTSNYGAVFFASSGDSGSSSGVFWPASSSNVVAVGGTLLNLGNNGTVISEIGWSESGGGVSAFETKPSYQTAFNVTYPKRAVPDVSYNAGAGIAVYSTASGGWISVGGTSAGAPQWAAIQALGHSATNANLYAKAQLAYSSYFADIVTGSNGAYSASSGYDLVTGLGSPLTCNFGANLTISPSTGPSGGAVALNGEGFTSNSSVKISWLNSLSFNWTTLTSNVSTDSIGNFTYPFNAPELLQNNMAGDNPPKSDNIVFRVQDNSNGKSINTTVPYSEGRRGLTQIDNQSATGLFGNNTDFTTIDFVQNVQSINVAGKWFSPGNVSLFWDGTESLGTAMVDGTGQFNATIQVPNTTAGKHMITINDGVTNFCVNITRSPALTTDYVDQWHTSPFPIYLTADYNVNETYYSINGGPVSNVTGNGQPIINSDGGNNTLEYWSTWNVYGTGLEETPHSILTGIKLDTAAPTGSIYLSNSPVATSNVILSLSATDDVSGVSQMRFSNGDGQWSNWEPFASSKTWTLQGGDGTKNVTVEYSDNAGLISTPYSSTVTLQTMQTSPQTSQITTTPQSSSSPSPTSTATTSTPTATPTDSPTFQPSKVPVTPELNIQTILLLLVLATLAIAITYKRKHI
jgi:subtilase family serine protease